MFRALLTILIITCCSFHVPQEVSADAQVIKVAESQLSAYLAKIPQGNESDYGFTDKDNMEKCEIGRPYRMLTFNNDFYTANLVESTNYIDVKNEWRVPVRLTGQNRVLLTVNGNPGNFTVSEMGGTELAKELQEKSMSMDTADAYYILRVYPLSADFFVSEHDNSFSDAKFIPLASAIMAIPSMTKSKKSGYSLDEVQQIVKEAIANKQKEPVKKKAPPKSKKKKNSKILIDEK